MAEASSSSALKKLALDVEDLELGGEPPLVAEGDQRERPAVRRHAALALDADLPHLAVEDEGVLDLAECLLDRLQIQPPAARVDARLRAAQERHGGATALNLYGRFSATLTIHTL